MAKDEALVVEPAKDDELHELQQHLRLEAFGGKYLTAQEMLLQQLFQSVADAADAQASELSVSAPAGTGVSPKVASTATLSRKSSLGTMGKGGGATPPSATTPKRQISSDRARVQSFLAQRSSAGTSSSVAGSGAAGAGTKPAMSAGERAKLLMAKKTGGARAAGSSTAVKRTNPLTDILRGGSGSVVGGVHSVKKLRTARSDKPGEIKIQGGRTSIQLPLESFLRSEDWDSATGTPLDLVLQTTR